MVLLSAQDSDVNTNSITAELCKVNPNIKTLALTSIETLHNSTNKVRKYQTTTKWFIEIAQTIKEDKNIPTDINGLLSLNGIGRKSANVIMIEFKLKPKV